MTEFSMNEPDSSFLCNFATDVYLPETVQIVDGYDSVDSQSEDLSWSRGEIVHFHSLKDLTRVIARDEGGKHYAIPLTYPEKIFEIIPKGCGEKYERVEELITAFPKYVRSLRDIPESAVMKGDVLKVINGSRKRLKCRIVGKKCIVFLPVSLLGPFETMENVNSCTIRDVFDRQGVPARVRVLSGKTKAFDRTNKTPSAKFEGLFFLERVVQQKTFIVSTMNGGQLRVTKLPIDLEITVRREKSKPEPKLFSRICHLIETEVDIDSTITCGSTGDASWYFDCHEEVEKPAAASDDDHMYEELRPPVPPRRSPGSDQHTYQSLERVTPKDRNRAGQGGKSLQGKEADQKQGKDGAAKESHMVSEQSNPKEALSSDPQSIDSSQDHQMTGDGFRKHLQGMSVFEVAEYLRKLGLSKYVAVFDQESIDGTMLMEMDDEMMQCIGINNLFHRKKLLMFAQQGYTPKR